jgi:RimJ/RimL family protein N-acetyltransferase
MRLHVEALFTHDPQGCLIGVNVPNGAPAPRFFIGSTDNGSVVRWRSDVDGDTQRDLEAAAANDQRPLDVAAAPADISVYAEILGRSAPVERTWSGPAFCFPKRLPATIGAVAITSENASVLQPLLPAWIPDVDLNPPVFAVIVDGQAVAVCCSVRRTGAAHEAGVETVPAFRGQGHAGRAVVAWARAVRDMGCVPLYSTLWQNEASRAVARTLGLIHFGSDLHLM